MLPLLLVFATSFFVVLYSTPALIKVAILKRLFDEPGGRKIHKRIVPTIGGVIIFAATLFSFALWYKIDIGALRGSVEQLLPANQYITEFKLIIATSLVLFFVGIKDDIIGTAPIKKLVAHVLVGLILVLIGNVRITGLHGIFGVYELPYWASVFLSLFTYIVVVNAYNLIDGVDGLAGGVGFITAASFAFWFIMANDYVYASLSVALAGSLLGFLVFNFSPAKIFMGDSGSLTIGLIICVLSIKVVEYPVDKLTEPIVKISKPVYVIASLIYPLADTLRVFVIRATKGISPFSADRNHLHHRLMDCGLGHVGTVTWIYVFSIMTIGVSFLSYFIDHSISLIIVAAFAAICAIVLQLIYRAKNPTQQTSIEFKE
jgi:UDP-N-acetylmuramyl pentapeptide phosphotransferase/UDP-N-acetylglucosamine-1-phosphate transferase